MAGFRWWLLCAKGAATGEPKDCRLSRWAKRSLNSPRAGSEVVARRLQGQAALLTGAACVGDSLR